MLTLDDISCWHREKKVWQEGQQQWFTDFVLLKYLVSVSVFTLGFFCCLLTALSHHLHFDFFFLFVLFSSHTVICQRCYSRRHICGAAIVRVKIIKHDSNFHSFSNPLLSYGGAEIESAKQSLGLFPVMITITQCCRISQETERSARALIIYLSKQPQYIDSETLIHPANSTINTVWHDSPLFYYMIDKALALYLQGISDFQFYLNSELFRFFKYFHLWLFQNGESIQLQG